MLVQEELAEAQALGIEAEGEMVRFDDERAAWAEERAAWADRVRAEGGERELWTDAALVAGELRHESRQLMLMNRMTFQRERLEALQADIQQLQDEREAPVEGLGARVLRVVTAPIRVAKDVAVNVKDAAVGAAA